MRNYHTKGILIGWIGHTYLDNHTADILEKVMAGTISVPEMVAELRQKVPQAATVDASAIAGLVGSHRFSNATLHIPDVRRSPTRCRRCRPRSPSAARPAR